MHLNNMLCVLLVVIVALWCSLRFISEMIFFLLWLLENPVALTPQQYELLAVNPKGTVPYICANIVNRIDEIIIWKLISVIIITQF